ncbi:hypothetical protein SNEBB_007537 [Seison nebaliae]|nr:hypothetical protein SNEBB_007537 [Seison nebaliae]
MLRYLLLGLCLHHIISASFLNENERFSLETVRKQYGELSRNNKKSFLRTIMSRIGGNQKPNATQMGRGNWRKTRKQLAAYFILCTMENRNLTSRNNCMRKKFMNLLLFQMEKNGVNLQAIDEKLVRDNLQHFNEVKQNHKSQKLLPLWG